MKRKIYALLVGINDYPIGVRNLQGCVNDSNNIKNYLKDNFKHCDLCIEILKNSEATRANIIKQFRRHLCKAGPNDIVLFHYSGHGSREPSAPEFKEFFPEGKDETLVCYDSRTKGGLDLADKELAILLSEIAVNNPHIAVIIDSCHSGSMTREPEDFNLLGARSITEKTASRLIDSYLDGYYNNRVMSIPRSKHILLAACNRTQRAWEAKDKTGVFTSALLNVLEKSNSNISYADLFVGCRTLVRQKAENQTPQFETYQRFHAYTRFLDGQPVGTPHRYSVYCENNTWVMECGALHGLPTEPEKNIEIALYPEFSRTSAKDEISGHAEILSVGAQKSMLKPDFLSDITTHYKAEIISLPVPPMAVGLEGDDTGKNCLQSALDTSLSFVFTTEPTKYVVVAENGNFLIRHSDTNALIQGVEGYSKESVQYIFSILGKIVRWERGLALRNHNTRFNPDGFDVTFFEILDDSTEYEHQRAEITLDFIKTNGSWKELRAKIKARNRTKQKLYVTFVYLSIEFEIHVLTNDTLEPGENFVTLWGDGEEDYFYLPEGFNQVIDAFKLIVSTEKVDDFLLEQEPLELGKIISLQDEKGREELAKAVSTRAIGKSMRKLIITNDWFTKTIMVKTVRQLNQVSEQAISIANNQISIKGHSSFKANIGLGSAKSSMLIEPIKIIPKVFENKNFQLLDFSSTRSGNQSVLELTEIRNEEKLKAAPFEIVLNTPLKDDEFVLPLTFDGIHFVLVGEPCKDERGNALIRINHIPDIRDERRRSLGKSLKLCFFKVVLEREITGQLRWVEYKPDGSIVSHKDNIKEQVSQAQKILLLIHGIIGDAELMAKSLHLATDKNDESIVDKYDVILTYNYENLNTSIQDTAKLLKLQLKDIGLHEKHKKDLTLLTHSMGGLVARWFIEQEDGNKIVQHLIMVGVPNNGTAFGDMTTYRNFAMTAITLSLNYLKPYIVYASAMLFALNQSKKITHTLEQMKEGSAFLKDLNASSDPNVRYSILAGDITDYKINKENRIAELIEKIEIGIGKLLYREQPNDIFASVDSMNKIDDFREPQPEKVKVVCHHLNYFESEAGLDGLVKICKHLL